MTPPKDLAKAYQAFFHESEAGAYFMNQIHNLIDQNHRDAESDADHARDFTQSARGQRQVLSLITSTATLSKKGDVANREG